MKKALKIGGIILGFLILCLIVFAIIYKIPYTVDETIQCWAPETLATEAKGPVNIPIKIKSQFNIFKDSTIIISINYKNTWYKKKSSYSQTFTEKIYNRFIAEYEEFSVLNQNFFKDSYDGYDSILVTYDKKGNFRIDIPEQKPMTAYYGPAKSMEEAEKMMKMFDEMYIKQIETHNKQTGSDQ